MEKKIEWAGNVPDTWDIKKAKYLFAERSEKGNPIQIELLTPSQKYGVVPQSKYQDITGSKPVQVDVNKDLSTFKTLRNGDFCISLSAYMGGFEYSEYEGVISPAYHAFYKTTNNVYNKYYKYLFKCTAFIDEINRITPQSVRVGRNTSFEKFGELLLPIPSLREQEKIADFLDGKCAEIDALYAEIEKQVEKLEEYKKSVITEAVTKGLNPDVKMKYSGVKWIGEIPEDWEIKKIKYVSTLSRGVFGHRPRNDPKYYDGEYPFIQTGDVATANKYINSYSQTLSELGKGVSKEFKKGTIAFTLAANVGDAAILNFDSYFPDSVMAIIPDENINNIYLYYILSVMKSEFLRVAIVNTQLNLNVERVGNVSVPITFHKSEQQYIVEYLDAKCAEIDGAIEGKKIQLETLEEYKKSLIYEYVTGKKEVPDNE